jgi:thiol-disulfide isomerase/thioredoxin
MKKNYILPIALCILPLLLTSCGVGSYDNLTQCLNKKQVVMFGASWCPHCAAQKQLFGRSVKDMPYFECSKDGEQVKECNDRKIVSYPTWQFQEATLSTLPKEAITNLLNTELEKVRGTSKIYLQTFKEKADIIKKIKDFDAKTEKLISSDVSEFEKLKKLTSLSADENGVFQEVPVYNAGRISGERTLADIALYAGCSTEYQADISASKK